MHFEQLQRQARSNASLQEREDPVVAYAAKEHPMTLGQGANDTDSKNKTIHDKHERSKAKYDKGVWTDVGIMQCSIASPLKRIVRF